MGRGSVPVRAQAPVVKAVGTPWGDAPPGTAGLLASRPSLLRFPTRLVLAVGVVRFATPFEDNLPRVFASCCCAWPKGSLRLPELLPELL
jgi:hypothetical protein